MDEKDCIERITTLAQAAWALRDSMLQRGALSPDIVRLEESIHQLEQHLSQLTAVLGVTAQAKLKPPIT